MEIKHHGMGITFSDEYSDITFKNEHDVMEALSSGNKIINSNKTIYMAARGNGRTNDATIDALRYYCNDILTTQQYYTAIKISTMTIKKVIFNDPATIIIWNDGTKKVVKCSEDESFDPEKGLAMAICKKVLGDKFKAYFKHFIPKEDNNLLTMSQVIDKLRNLSNILK